MRIGLNGGGHWHRLQDILDHARGGSRSGFRSYWLSQITGPDILTTLAVIGREEPSMELGASVVPAYPRHPMALAIQALTVQAAVGGRLVLGIGPSHRPMVEEWWGYSYSRPFGFMREYVRTLRSLLAGHEVDWQGEFVTARGRVTIEAPAPPLLLGALGPRMLELAGSETEGVVTWMVGPKTLADYIVPRVREAAERAGRPKPRIVAGILVCVTSDPDGARHAARERLALYGTLPAYRAMLEREGVASPEDLLIAGGEARVREGLEAYAAAGATDVRVTEMGRTDAERARTRELLEALLEESRAG